MELTKEMIQASYAQCQHPASHGSSQAQALTMEMEMVASAKGSPMMRPTLKVARWP